MPNTGKPSKDCHRCRKRRVKCDLGRPQCQRCLKLGKSCPGYRDEADLIFKNEDVASLAGENAPKDRRRSRPEDHNPSRVSSVRESPGVETSTLQEVPVSNEQLSEMDMFVFSSGWLSPPSRTMIPPWTSYTIPLVLSMFSVKKQHSRNFEAAAFLPEILSQCSEDSALALSCHALGFAYLANKSGSPESKRVRDEMYVRALGATNTILGDDFLRTSDEAAVSVWLLSVFEVVQGSAGSAGGSNSALWTIHAEGLVGLLRARGPEQLLTKTGRDIFWLLTLSTQINSMISLRPYPTFIQTWLEEFGLEYPDCDPDFVHLGNYAGQAADILSKILATSVQKDPQYQGEVSAIWNQVNTLLESLDRAIAEHPFDDPFDLHNLFLANQYRAYGIRVLHNMLDLAISDDVQFDGTITQTPLYFISVQTYAVLESLCDATLQTVQYVLGESFNLSPGIVESRETPSLTAERQVCWSDVIRLLWPLRIMSCRPHLLSESHRDLLYSALQHMGSKYCIRLASERSMAAEKGPGTAST